MKRFYRAIIGIGFAAICSSLPAADVLIINGSGSASIAGPLTAAGFNVIQDAYNPGVIASHLAADSAISQIWIWNDGTFGNSGSPAQPSLAFNTADQLALSQFNAAHSQWIMDGLSWRNNANINEQNFTKNEGLNLAHAGGGIVLGADDASGDAILQHVNQVASWFNFKLFTGVYSTLPASQHVGGSLFTDPNLVDPTQVIGTTTYSEVPNGLQPNGLFLGTAVFGLGTPLQGFTPYVVPTLPNQTFDGILYDQVNHLVTTTIPGASIDQPVPDRGTTLVLMTIAVAALALFRATRLAAQPRAAAR